MICRIPGDLALGEYREKLKILCPSVIFSPPLDHVKISKNSNESTYAQLCVWEELLNDPRIIKEA